MNDNNKKDKLQEDSPKAVPLAIVGIGCLFPKANDAASFWQNIRDGVDAIDDIPDTHWKPEDYFDADKTAPDMTYARRGGFIDAVDFDPLLYGLSPNNIEATDSTQLLGMVVARQALLDAGYATASDSDDGRQFDRDRCSVILGVTGTLELVIPLGARLGHPIWRKALADAGIKKDAAEDIVQRISDGYVPWQENSFPGLLGNVAAGRIANRFDLGGTNCVVDAACASSLSALHMAAMELYAGRSDMAITGGFDTFNDIFMYMCFSKTPALSPTGNSKPFDLNGDGTILGEGLGAVILKRLDDAQRDGDQIYAVLKGIGSSSDGRGNAIYAPSAKGQTKALRDAYDQANVSPRSIELLEAHGTGTKVGDAVEAEALSGVYREAQAEGSWCAIGSVKSMIGHTKAAAGVAGLIKIALALRHKVLPPTIKVQQPLQILEPGDAPVYVNAEKRPWIAGEAQPRRAALSAFGFGGSNFHCVLEEIESEKAAIEWDGKVLLLAYSADTQNELAGLLNKIAHQQDWSDLRAAAAQSLQSFDKAQPYRVSLVVTEQSKLEKLIQSSVDRLSQEQAKTSWSTPDGAYFASGKDKGELALLFPGQGSQYTNMLLDLACQFPQMQSSLAMAQGIKSEFNSEQKLNDLIYPISVFNKVAAEENEKTLRLTQNAQPALGASSMGAHNVLQHFGLLAQASAGHSFGELSALAAAGVISEEDLHRLANKRGELMQAKDGDHGAMLAVAASAAVVHEFLEAEPLELIIANNNAPAQVVLSGASADIDQALIRLKQRGVIAKKLPVSAAFHSIYVSEAEKPFAKFLEDINFEHGDVSVYANTTSELYPGEAKKSKALLAGQLAQPVEFVAQIENMYASGFRTFVEVGPGKVLSTMVKSILGEKEHHSIAVDASRGKRGGQYDLACVLAQISVLGHEVKMQNWDADYLDTYEAPDTKAKLLMTIKVGGANYVKPRTARPPIAASAPRSEEHANFMPVKTVTPIQKLPTSQLADSDALKVTQQSIITLQKMQEQTALLHKQYLESQETAQQNLQQLIAQQHQLLTGEVVAPLNIQLPPVAAAPAQTPTAIPDTASPVVTTPAAVETEAELLTQPGNDSAHYETLLLEVVADKTGYPIDMLSMDMSLDTDLGIDSIKRVEILSALQEKLPGVGKIQPEDLGTFQMLKHIVEFLATDAPAEAAPVGAVKHSSAKYEAALLAVVADKTGYPTDMLNLDMSMDSDLGIDSIKRVEILSGFQELMPDAPAVNPEDLASLQTLQQIVDFMHEEAAPVHDQVTQTAPSIEHDNKFEDTLLEVVADKTGYPVDMLSPAMNMDTDLGIDSIKRVEILSAFQERMPEAPTVNPEDLASLQTLQQIIDFMQSQDEVEEKPVPSNEVASSDTGDDKIQTVLLDVVADKTGYPVEMLSLEMNMDTDLGIDSIKRVEILSAFQSIMPEAPAVNPEDLASLQTLQQIVEHMAFEQSSVARAVEPAETTSAAAEQEKIYRSTVGVKTLANSQRKRIELAEDALVLVSDDGSDLPAKICSALAQQKLRSEIVALDAQIDSNASALIILSPANADAEFIYSAFQLLQNASQSLKTESVNSAALLIGVSRLGGAFGIENISKASAVGGGLAGIVKTADKEWSDVHCKMIDIPANRSSAQLAAKIVEEALKQGPLEVGIDDEGLNQIALSTSEIGERTQTNNLFSAADLVIITGGARGVTAEVAVAIAEDMHCNLLLLGRSPLPDQEAAYLNGLDDEAAIKKAIIENAGSGKPALAEVEESYRQIISKREISHNLKRIQDSGVNVSYEAVDVRDRSALASVVKAARDTSANIAGIIHGAGVLADRLIEDKTREQFKEVYATKVEGIQNLLYLCKNDALKVVVMFSSSTARFGRKGQIDYAVANEILNKIAQQEQNKRSDCRVLSVNWGPWDGGMVTPQLKKLFESEGVGVIPLKAGANYLLDEISSAGPVEVVVLGSELVSEEETQYAQNEKSLHLVIERQLNVSEYPVLKSHVMNGKAVLPAALIAEWLAHGAMHNHPGLSFLGLNDFRILKGVVIEAEEEINLQIMASQSVMVGEEDRVHIEIRNGAILHASAEVVLGTAYVAKPVSKIKKVSGEYPFTNKEYYSNGQLFHGPALQCIETIDACCAEGISGHSLSAPSPTEWMTQPMRSTWLADPMILDASFQMMILWSFQQSNTASLPTRIASYRQFQSRLPKDGASLNIKIIKVGQHSATAIIDILDKQQKLVARIEGYECVIDASLNEAFKRNTLEQSVKA